VADKLTTTIFTSVPIEEKIEEVLPPRAEFLAAPLTEQLRDRTAQRMEQIVSSDPFQDIWISANRRAMDRMLTQARSEDGGDARQLRVFAIDLDGMRPIIQQRFEENSPVLAAVQEKGARFLEIRAGLDAARNRVRDFVTAVDTLNDLLPAVFIASITGVLALSVRRRKALFITALAGVGWLLIALIAIRFSKHQLLAGVQFEQYIPAVSTIYDSLFDSLRNAIFSGMLAWLAVAVLTALFGGSAWAVGVRRFLRIYDLSDSKPTRWVRRARSFTADRYSAIVIAIAGFVLLILAFAATPEPVLIVQSLLFSLSLIFCLHALADVRSNRPGTNDT
jgi:hypothetical protein